MPLIQLTKENGSWTELKADWEEQCKKAEEDFALYAQGTFIVLNQLADNPEKRAGIFALPRENAVPDIICQVNTTPLPGHPDPVLRVRMVTVCPEIDFGVADAMDRYIDTMADLFVGIVELSLNGGDLAANEFKLHLRSPHDVTFFRVMARHFAGKPYFKNVAVHGAWLHVTKG